MPSPITWPTLAPFRKQKYHRHFFLCNTTGCVITIAIAHRIWIDGVGISQYCQWNSSTMKVNANIRKFQLSQIKKNQQCPQSHQMENRQQKD
jgi:hypothetical protein